MLDRWLDMYTHRDNGTKKDDGWIDRYRYVDTQRDRQ